MANIFCSVCGQYLEECNVAVARHTTLENNEDIALTYSFSHVTCGVAEGGKFIGCLLIKHVIAYIDREEPLFKCKMPGRKPAAKRIKKLCSWSSGCQRER